MQLSHLVSLASLAGVVLAACNGHDAFCDRKYSNITMVGSHNSAFVGVLPIHNQFVSVTSQLNLGVRFLQAQARNKNGVIELCHTYCWELDAGPLTNYLGEIAGWMAEHPDEVVTVLFTNHDELPVTQFDKDFNSAGLEQYVFRPDGNLTKEEWPTLQEMIDANTRLVTFMDSNSSLTQVDYILDEFTYFWETPFGVTDGKFPNCSVDRPEEGDPKQLMGIMNHMLNYNFFGIIFPDIDSAGETNSMESIQAQVDLCVKEHSVQPNVVLLDWINVGDAIEAQLGLNGL